MAEDSWLKRALGREKYNLKFKGHRGQECDFLFASPAQPKLCLPTNNKLSLDLLFYIKREQAIVQMILGIRWLQHLVNLESLSPLKPFFFFFEGFWSDV